MRATKHVTPKPRNDGTRLLAKNEAKAFAELVWRGSMTVEEALQALSIPPYDRICLEDFAAQQGGTAARDIRKVIRLRDLAVGEFVTLVSSSHFQH